MSRLQLLFLGFALVCCSVSLAAQNIQIFEEPTITKMMDRFTEINKAQANIDGWRIQILATTDRQKLESVKQSFRYQYPNVPIDWIHSKPYYKLRAGAFATKLEALRLKYILEQEYSGIYLVRDDAIRPQELIGTY